MQPGEAARIARAETHCLLDANVFLPFATGYFLSYLFRTINGPIAERLMAAFHLDTAELGLLTSVYFLTCAASTGEP